MWLQSVTVPLSPTVKQTHSSASPFSAGKRPACEHSRLTQTHTDTACGPGL